MSNFGTTGTIDEIVILSGKGGTGKTTITGAFATLASRERELMVADCDVDASDLHLLLKPQIQQTHQFIAGHQALIDPSLCSGCGLCAEVCRFGAITGAGSFQVDKVGCEGCGVCVRACPEKAITFPDRHCGEWFISRGLTGTMVHARLSPGAENSGKLVTTVRRRARDIAVERGIDRIIVDGPPGIGCPVIASMTGSTRVLAVTEPTLSGEHDLIRVLKLASHFGIPVSVCVNRSDINPEITDRIRDRCEEMGARWMGSIPFDMDVPRAQVMGKPLMEYSGGAAAEAIKKIWSGLA